MGGRRASASHSERRDQRLTKGGWKRAFLRASKGRPNSSPRNERRLFSIGSVLELKTPREDLSPSECVCLVQEKKKKKEKKEQDQFAKDLLKK